MIVDFDDFCEADNRLDLLTMLREANPAFRCTLFAIPAGGRDAFWDLVPYWCELAVHGWDHSSSREAAEWSYERALEVIEARPLQFVRGFKAPGWQVSDGTYRALADRGWWIADHWENEGRIPDDLARHVISSAAGAGIDPDHWHGHIPDVCGNGIAETFSELRRRVKDAESFELVSEVVV